MDAPSRRGDTGAIRTNVAKTRGCDLLTYRLAGHPAVHRLGDAGSVSFPPELQGEIAEYALSGHAHEVLVFHNHPSNAINALVDNEPWASPQDRAIAMSHVHDLRMWIKTASEGRRVRFYLGENGYVREFVGPDFLSLLGSWSQR